MPKLITGLWELTDGTGRIAVTRNTSVFDPKNVIGNLVPINGKWKIEGSADEYGLPEEALLALIKKQERPE
jgi:hypothetical protein